MATQFTRFADKAILNAMFKGVAVPNITWYVGALKYLDDNVAAGSVTPNRDTIKEVPAGANPAYARVPLGSVTLADFVVNGAAAFVSNDAQGLFAEAATEWGNIVGLGLYDASTGGNLWVVTFAANNAQRYIRVGDRLTVPAQQLVVAGGAT
jgi:hypothetical protein